MKDNKLLVHFHSSGVTSYLLEDSVLKLVSNDFFVFDETSLSENFLLKIDYLFKLITERFSSFPSKSIRIYATQPFQFLTNDEQVQLSIHVFVACGLSFRIIPPELEQFYIDKSTSVFGAPDMMKGLILQEFRRVVICGSFQKHLSEIDVILSACTNRGIEVLSPWTTKVVPSSLGSDFLLLEGQELVNKRDAWRHKYIHMNKFRSADAIIVCNPGGAVGKGTLFEFGFMVAVNSRIIFMEEPEGLSTIPFPFEVGLNFI